MNIQPEPTKKPEANLKVMEALQEEAYKGVVRIDAETMHILNIHPGEVIEIEGSRKTVGIADRAYPTDVGQQVIRMDGILRRNAKTGIGESVKVRKAEIKEAKNISIAPAQKGVLIRADPEIFKRALLGRAITKGDILVPSTQRPRRRAMTDNPLFDEVFNMFEDFPGSPFGLSGLRFIVVNTAPKDAVLITESTELTLIPKSTEVSEEKIPEVTYEDVGGLSDEVKKIREMVELPLKHPEIFIKLGIEPPAGVLLHGPPGSGKTLLAKAVANESEANFILVNGPEIINKFYGECVSEDSLVLTNGQGLTTIKEATQTPDVHKIAGLNFETQKMEMLPISDRFDKGLQETRTIKTPHGSITATPTSKLLLLREGKQEWGFVKDLKPMDLVATIKNFPKEKNLSTKIEEELKILKNNSIIWSPIKVIEESKAHVYDFTVPNEHNFIANGFVVHNSEKRIREIFEDAEKNAPSIIFFDEIDAIASKRDEVYGEVERRIVSQLLTQMDGLKSRGKVIVIGATNRPNSIDPALRRPGRFDREIVIGPPDRKGRLNVLKIHTRNMPLTKDVKLNRLADITHGFVGADISALCKEAAMNVLRRVLPDLKLGEKDEIPEGVFEKLRVTQEDFEYALKLVRPSSLREVLIETPKTTWEDIGGLESIKQELKEAVEWPLKNSQVFKRLGIRPSRGLLMYGPPGTGKTLLAKAVANESEANFILVRGPELLNKWVGDSEKGVRKIFEKARQSSPAIIFFDEIDAIAPRRGLSESQVTDRVVNTILAEMDGLEELAEVIIIGATNRPDIIDSALLRPGRFDKLLLTPPPNEKGRQEIFKIHTKSMPLSKDVNLGELAKKTEGFVGADIEAVCREAAMLALREDIKAKEVSSNFFIKALDKVKPSISKELMDKYQEIEEGYFRKARAGLAKEIPSYVG